MATASADKPTARYAGGTAGAQWKGTKKIAVDTVEALAGPAASEVASSSPTMRPHNNGKSVRHGAPTNSRDAKNLHVHKNASGVAESLQQVTRMVHIIMRHGQRTPKFVLPNDDRKNWPEHLGPGMLTASGALTMTQLGAEERARYIGKEHLLSPSYVRDEVYVRSTDIDRSLQSAESFLRGFFPSRGIALFPPIHTVKSSEDILLRGYDHCHKYHQFVAETLASASIANELSKDESLMKTLSKATGVHVSPQNIKAVADTVLLIREFMVQESNEIDSANSLIGALSASDLQRLQEILDYVNHLTKGQHSMARLMVGNLLREMSKQVVYAALRLAVEVSTQHERQATCLRELLQLLDQNVRLPQLDISKLWVPENMHIAHADSGRVLHEGGVLPVWVAQLQHSDLCHIVLQKALDTMRLT